MRLTCGILLIPSLLLGCKKDAPPKAVITVITEDKSAAEGAEVNFYIDKVDKNPNSLDTTLVTNDKGIVTYTARHECYPDVFVKYGKNRIYYSGQASISMKVNEVTYDTIMVK